jgi:hypothetical protein
MKQKVTVMLAMLTLLVLPAFSSLTDDWTLLAEDGGVKAYYQLGTCDSRNVMFLKIENTLPGEVSIDFLFLLENNPPSPTRITLQANQTLTGQCMNTTELLKYVTNNSTNPAVTINVIN